MVLGLLIKSGKLCWLERYVIYNRETRMVYQILIEDLMEEDNM
jgi:hypothetical protein